MSLHDDAADPNTPRRVHEWTREQIDAAQCGLCNLADVQVTCAAGASKHALENLRFRLHIKWGTVEVPLKTPLLPLNITQQDIADSFGCSPLDATLARKSYRLWLVAINPRTGGFEEVITRNGGSVVVTPDEAPVRPWDCDPQHAAQVNAEFASYQAWRAKNAGRHHLTGQPWTAPEEDGEGFRIGDDDGDGDDGDAFAPPRPPQRFAPQAFPQAPQAFPQAPQAFPQAPQAFPQLPMGVGPQAFPQAPHARSAVDAELAEVRAALAELKADKERREQEARERALAEAREETERLRRELEDARRTPQKSAGTTEIVSAVGGVVTALSPLLQMFSENAKAAAAREEARRTEEEKRREETRKEERDREAREERRREEARREEEKRRDEARKEERDREEKRREDEEKREERRRDEARRDEEKREERRREERAEAHKERMATLKAGGGAESAMAEALAAVRAEIAELKGGGKKDKGGILGAIREAREIASLFGGKTDALDAAAKAAESGDQNQTLEIIDAVGERLEAPMKMLASEFMADRQARREAAAKRRGGYVQRGSGLLAAKRAKLQDGTEIDVPDDMVLLNDGALIPLAAWGGYVASLQAPQVQAFPQVFAPAFPQAPMFAPPQQAPMFAPPQPEEPQQAPMFAPPQPEEPQQAPEEPQQARVFAPPQPEVIPEASEAATPRIDDGPMLDHVPEFTG